MEKREWMMPTSALRDAMRFCGATGGGDEQRHLRFKFGDRQLALTAFNGLYWNTAVIELESTQIEEFLVDPKVLMPLMTVMTPSFTVTLIENKCRIKWMNGDIRFSFIPVTEFPPPPAVSAEVGVYVDLEDLKAGYEKVKAALMRTKSMLSFESPALVCDGLNISMVGTDRSRMHTTVIPCGIESTPSTILLPTRMMNSLCALKTTGRVSITWNDFLVRAETIDRKEIIGAKVQGQLPPNWQKVLSFDSAFSYEIDRVTLESCMLRFAVTHDNECKVGFKESTPGTLEMNAKSTNPPRTSRETIPCVTTGDSGPFILDAVQVLDALRACKPSEKVILDLTNNSFGRYTAVLKPSDPEVSFKSALALFSA